MQSYRGKSVAILGLSVEGIDSTLFFVHEGAIVTCCDRRTKKELAQTYTKLARDGVSFQLGNGYLSHLARFDLLVRTPGMSLGTPELVGYRDTITSQTKLFFDLCPAPIIGVTGTKGKGTTSSLIAEMLKKFGQKVFLGGNVGTPLLSKVRAIAGSSSVVLELSSFQLEDLTKSPHIAVVLPITQDHLVNIDPLATSFHKTRKAYREAKTSIVRFQTKNDIVIANLDNETSKSFGTLSPGRTYFVSRKKHAGAYVENQSVFVRWDGKMQKVCEQGEIHLRGEHNLENIGAASLAALAAGATIRAVRSGAKQFKGLPHRLELAGTASGVSFYDDSFSTVPETTIAGVKSFDEPIILIAGGSEKGSDFSELGNVIANSRVKVLIAIGQMTDRIVKAARDGGFSGTIITGLTTMAEIVRTAFKYAKPGDVVLLSPAAASFDMFPNYKERGKQFSYEVTRL